jgi:L-alanine-DL-glutamate epimerase-like enolase superfamily enzyme
MVKSDDLGGVMKIECVETAYYRLPLEAMGDAGDGDIDTEELITLNLHAEGLTGHGYSYTIGRRGRAMKSLIDDDIVPMILGHDATDIWALWDLMWQRLLYVGRGGLATLAIGAVDVALWDLRGVREDRPLYALLGAELREIPAYGREWTSRSRWTRCSHKRNASWNGASPASR